MTNLVDPAGDSLGLVPADDIELVNAPPSVARSRSVVRLVLGWAVVKPFQLMSLILLLAVMSAVPLFQVIALGYLLEVSGRVARSGRLRDGLFLLDQAGKIGVAAAAVFLMSLPIRLLSNWALAAELVNPTGGGAGTLRIFGGLLVILVAAHVGWTWFRGGRATAYFRPRPFQFLTQIWRPGTWLDARDRLWDFVGSMELGKLFWLGLRGFVGTLLWLLVPASILIATTRQGQTGLAGFVGVIGFVLMGVVVLYLPMLQVRFATENRFRAMFEVAAVRRWFRAAPVFSWLGLAITFVFAVPLYLLKIERTPQEVVWLPCIVMVAFTLPARLMTGLAVGRAMRRDPKPGAWHKLLRSSMRLLCVPIVVGYLLIVFASGFTSWDGLATWLQQHALLIPVPFDAGV